MTAFHTTPPKYDMEDQVAAMKAMWAAKFLVHVKDYAVGRATASKTSINDKSSTGGLKSTNAIRAHLWFTSDNDKPASFVWICDLFGLDPERTRMQVFHGWRNLTRVGLPKADKPKLPNGKGRSKLRAKDKLILEEDDDE